VNQDSSVAYRPYASFDCRAVAERQK
jgi:hypothetical protein